MKNSLNILHIGRNNPNENHYFSLCAGGVDLQAQLKVNPE
jgi:hypothetical protein